MRVWVNDRYRRWRARVMATYISRRSSSRPSASVTEFSCGNRPSSRPVMKTASNSSPLAECTVISCTASLPSPAWFSPASSEACDRNEASGVMLTAPGAAASSTAASPPGAESPDPGALPGDTPIDAGTSWPMPSSARKAAAAVTSSRRFSMRSWPSFSAWKWAIRPLRSMTCSTDSVRVRVRDSRPRVSISRVNADSLAAGAPDSAPTAWNRLTPARRAASCSASTDRAPMPRAGKLTTRRKAPSSSGFSMRRR